MNFSKNIGEPYPRRRNEFPLVIGGNIRYNGSTSRSLSESESETFTTQYQSASFRNNRSNSNSGNNSVNGEFRMEWMPDSSLNIIFRPSFQISRNHSNSNSGSVTFNEDPYIATDMVNVLDEYGYLPSEVMDSIGVNSQRSNNHSITGNNQVSGEFQFNKRFNDLGRNFTIRFTFGATRGTNDSYSHSNQGDSIYVGPIYLRIMEREHSFQVMAVKKIKIKPGKTYRITTVFPTDRFQPYARYFVAFEYNENGHTVPMGFTDAKPLKSFMLLPEIINNPPKKAPVKAKVTGGARGTDELQVYPRGIRTESQGICRRHKEL